MDIFRKMIGDHECFSMSVENRLADVKKCESIEDLKDTLNRADLQKTVDKAIRIKLKKLEKRREGKKEL